ncbi:type II toxin-antitoxin system HicB family antitoxin [bacterium]|nr:type II toxin-antitoxin system HicB family antitoxin [bacterium]
MEMRYGLVTYWSKAERNFLVDVPELPGCVADGATYEEAVANAQAVISGWLETATALSRPIPEPWAKRDFFQP